MAGAVASVVVLALVFMPRHLLKNLTEFLHGTSGWLHPNTQQRLAAQSGFAW